MYDVTKERCTRCNACGSPVPDCYTACFVCLNDESRRQIQKLKQEVSILRQYGNKDCTAMADKVLEKGNV